MLTVRSELVCDKCGKMFDEWEQYDGADMDYLVFELRRAATDEGWKTGNLPGDTTGEIILVDYCPECAREL